jgi:predicted transcriptional regulator
MEEEVQRVFDALDGLAAIGDPKARALAVVKVLKGWPQQSTKLRELRRQAILELLAPEEASVRKVAKELGVSPSTVQDIASGNSRWDKRPKGEAEEKPA